MLRLFRDDDESGDMESLYHYTTAAGLQGILSGQTLWASDLRFLNDTNEGRYAYDLIVDAVAQLEHPGLRVDQPARGNDAELGYEFAVFKDFVALDLNSPDIEVFVACFCESGDLLSQWRAYGSDHGYAIEFGVAGLRQVAEDWSSSPSAATLVQVQYGDSAPQVVQDAMQGMVDDPNIDYYMEDAPTVALHLKAALASIKHPGFREEREWRLVVGLEHYGGRKVRFRSTPMAIVPYVEVPFARDMIQSIRIGPGQHVDTREVGIDRLLRHMGCEVPVLRSEVPLRT